MGNGVDVIEPLGVLRALFAAGAEVVASYPASVALPQNNSSSMFDVEHACNVADVEHAHAGGGGEREETTGID